MKARYAIEARGLTKKFDDLTAVNRVNLEIKDGEVFGLLGPNGAGKTTLIHMPNSRYGWISPSLVCSQ